MNLAPIVLFVYNRLWHTQQTIEALQKNDLAQESELFIYADNARNADAFAQVQEVRNYVKTIDRFKKITIIERDDNMGLDPSIVDGVTKIVNEYGKIIVLEDDIVTSPYFLKFMNDALDFYQNNQKVWHISGWICPIDTDDLDDAFLWQLMNCWGWATWSNRWKCYEPNLQKSVGDFSVSDVKRFDFGIDYGFWDMVKVNLAEKDNNWDIRWYATIFKQNGLCLNPVHTFVRNIGFDGSGKHCGDEDPYVGQKLCDKKDINFDIKSLENNIALGRIKFFFKSQKKSIIVRIINKIFRIVFGRGLIK